MNVAVTTASGQLGSAIIQALIPSLGAEHVVGITRSPQKMTHPQVEIRKGDYNSKEEFDLALQGVDVVMLVSGMDPPDKRIVQHQNVIHAARDAGVRKIVYSSIIGKAGSTTFDPIVNSNRQTEQDIRESGMEWSIGRNGLYIEPDVEYIETYKQEGKISNCAGEGLCSYTTRGELAYAYSRMILHSNRNQQVFNLSGQAISQVQLAGYLNLAFGTSLTYEAISPEAYLEMQRKNNGEFLGPIIAGIYQKIREGEFEVESGYQEAAGRKHLSWNSYFEALMGE
jgi:NAD(P)H dehydrogenase (quinone)